MTLLRVIREPVYTLVWAGLSFLIFDVCLYLMITLTGTRDGMCMVGANLTIENIIFSILLSLGFGLILTVLGSVLTGQMQMNANGTWLGALGGILGFLTLFCGICSLSVVTSIAMTLGLGFFSFSETQRTMNAAMEFVVEYNILIKVACLAMIGVTLWQLNKRMSNGWVCALPPRKKK